MSRLKRKGMLVLEVSIIENPNEYPEMMQGWHKASCAGETGIFPTWDGLYDMLHPYVYKYMSESVYPENKHITKHIFHVKNPLPYAVLLMGQSASGKTTVAKRLFKDFPVLHGDFLMRDLTLMPRDSLLHRYPYLNQICGENAALDRMGGIMIQLFNSAAGKEYACYVAEKAGNRDFVYEGCIHENFQNVFIRQLEFLGYQVLDLKTSPPEYPPNELFRRAREETRKYAMFLHSWRMAQRLRRR